MPTHSKYLLFVSSVQREFAAERREVKDFVEADPLLGRFFSVFPFEDIPASGIRPDEVYLEEVDRCSIYVGMFGNVSLFLARYIERAGTGTLDMAALCTEAGLPPPQFRVEQGQFIQVLPRKIQNTPEVTPEVTAEVRKLIQRLEGKMHRRDLQTAMDLKDDEHFRKAYLLPALEAGLIEMTIPDKPRSSKQQYRLTDRGKVLASKLNQKGS
jgi:ATP-dependent DNA helicase RecG